MYLSISLKTPVQLKYMYQLVSSYRPGFTVKHSDQRRQNGMAHQKINIWSLYKVKKLI